MLIKVAKIGSTVKEIRLDIGSVSDVLALSGESIQGFEPWIDGHPVPLNQSVEDGDIIALVPLGGIRGEADASVAGENWRYYANDPDKNWPSDFHAHSLQDRREVLDLRTGEVWNRTSRKFVRKMSEKHRLQIVDQIRRRINQ